MSHFCVGFVSDLRNPGWMKSHALDFRSVIWRMK
jgi:hypothetical protein